MLASNKSEEFEQLYDKYYVPIYRYIYKRILNVHDAEDLTMSVFAACWNKYDSFDPQKASFATWLYTITNNRLKNYYRDRKTSEELNETSAVEFGFEDDIINAQHLTQLRGELADALLKLSENQRKIVVMKYFGEKTSKEIGDELGLTPVTVRVQLFRTLKVLRKIMTENSEDFFE